MSQKLCEKKVTFTTSSQLKLSHFINTKQQILFLSHSAVAYKFVSQIASSDVQLSALWETVEEYNYSNGSKYEKCAI